MKRSEIRKLFLAMIFIPFLLVACGNEKSVMDDAASSTEESAHLIISTEEPTQLPVPTDAPAQTNTPDNVDTADNDGAVQYICRLDGSEHKQIAFYYENSELTKVEYSLNIKGMPEESEERKRLEDYSGVEMLDKAYCIVIEIDVNAGGIMYLKDTVTFFADVDNWTWENVKNKLEKNGYKIFDCSDDEILNAREVAEEYYKNTIFTVLEFYVKEAEKDKIVFGVHCSKGGEIVEPDRSITIEFINDEWVKTNEGY